jgi:hypothetical protein
MKGRGLSLISKNTRHITLRNFLLILTLLGLIAIVVVGVRATGYWPAARSNAAVEQPRPFSWHEFLPERAASDTDWEEKVRQGPLATYQALRLAIIKNRIDAGALSAFEAIISDTGSLRRIRAALDDLDGADRQRALADLYAAFMSAPSSPDLLLENLQVNIRKALHAADKNRDDNGRYFGWAIATNSYAAIVAFQHTGDRRFLDLAGDALVRSLSYRDSEIGRIDPFRGRAMHSWGGTRYTEDGKYATNITLGGRMAFALALFAETVRANDALAADYAVLADRFVEAARLAIDEYTPEFELTEDGAMGYYVLPTHGNDIEPLNHMAWAGNALIVLHGLTGDERYERTAEQLARFFRHCMRTDGDGGLYWRYQPEHGNFFGRGTEWVWKARVTAQFVHFAWQRGVVFTDEDVKGVTTMMLTTVLRPDGRVSARIDKFRDMEGLKDVYGGYLSITPFIAFANVDPALRERIEQLIATRPDIGGWRGSYAIEGYAYRLNAIGGSKPAP